MYKLYFLYRFLYTKLFIAIYELINNKLTCYIEHFALCIEIFSFFFPASITPQEYLPPSPNRSTGRDPVLFPRITVAMRVIPFLAKVSSFWCQRVTKKSSIYTDTLRH